MADQAVVAAEHRPESGVAQFPAAAGVVAADGVGHGVEDAGGVFGVGGQDPPEQRRGAGDVVGFAELHVQALGGVAVAAYGVGVVFVDDGVDGEFDVGIGLGGVAAGAGGDFGVDDRLGGGGDQGGAVDDAGGDAGVDHPGIEQGCDFR
ncbi:hypothetical protein BCA37_15485 [Mycobacterium sp. djl-10]|nr:hypothetical protein BCA37_15485 [Mycobacterium sp. djl-10]